MYLLLYPAMQNNRYFTQLLLPRNAQILLIIISEKVSNSLINIRLRNEKYETIESVYSRVFCTAPHPQEAQMMRRLGASEAIRRNKKTAWVHQREISSIQIDWRQWMVAIVVRAGHSRP
jgi:hypothetical protein